MTGAQVTRVLFDGRRAVGVESSKAARAASCGAARGAAERRRAAVAAAAACCRASARAPSCRQLACPVRTTCPAWAAPARPPGRGQSSTRRAWTTFGLSFGGACALGGIFEWRSRRSGMLTTNFAEAGGFIRSRPKKRPPDLQLHFVIGKLVDHGRKTVFGHGYSCHLCVLRPRSRGRVRLASADPLAAPLIDPAFLSDPDDIERMVRGFEADAPDAEPAGAGGLRRARTAGLGRRADRRRDRAVHPRPRRHHLPPGGQLPHGAGAGDDVVDARLRVHGCRGCAWSTRRSCRASSRATPTRRRS
jgi:hypothetical protein